MCLSFFTRNNHSLHQIYFKNIIVLCSQWHFLTPSKEVYKQFSCVIYFCITYFQIIKNSLFGHSAQKHHVFKAFYRRSDFQNALRWHLASTFCDRMLNKRIPINRLCGFPIRAFEYTNCFWSLTRQRVHNISVRFTESKWKQHKDKSKLFPQINYYHLWFGNHNKIITIKISVDRSLSSTKYLLYREKGQDCSLMYVFMIHSYIFSKNFNLKNLCR